MSFPKPTVMPRIVLDDGNSWPLLDAMENLLDAPDFARLWVCGYRAFEAVAWAKNEMGDSCRLAHASLQLVNKDGQTESVLIEWDGQSSNTKIVDFEAWGTDQLIEYLLAKSPNHCARAMHQITQELGKVGQESPELWSRILDRMIECEFSKSILELKLEELHASLENILAKSTAINSVDEIAHALLVAHPSIQEFEDGLPHWPKTLLQDRQLRIGIQVQYLVATLRALAKQGSKPEHFLSKIIANLPIAKQRHDTILRNPIASEVIKNAASQVANDPPIRSTLERFLDIAPLRNTAASLLFAIDSDWKPPAQDAPWHLELASFEGANWTACQLDGCRLDGLNLENGKFVKSSLQHARLLGLQAASTDWSYTVLYNVFMLESHFHYARFQHSFMREAQIRSCELTSANFEHANLRRSSFTGSCLDRASFQYANLSRSSMRNLTLEGCDFSYANLRYASLGNLDLSRCVFEVTNLSLARLLGCNLDSLSLNKCRLYRTTLRECSLTGTRFNGLNMCRCKLNDSRLGEIAWTNCDLRESDLRGCTFHFGSTRCGMVGSPYPSHGTRTGFYADDLERLYFEEPENVRRGSLQGCDLRGANIDGVDFYLIDLRDAKLDPWQKRQMSATGAILSE